MSGINFLVHCPPGNAPERDYVLNEIFRGRFGADWSRATHDFGSVTISIPGTSGRLILSDSVFERYRPGGRDIETAFAEGVDSFLRWQAREPRATSGRPGKEYSDVETFELPFDLFGLTFCFLSRVEETEARRLGTHDRFCADQSWGVQYGIADRPIVDEMIECLRSSIEAIWPAARLKQSEFTLALSHDVDEPMRYGFCGVIEACRRAAADALKRNQWSHALRMPFVRMSARRSEMSPYDPSNTFQWLMDVSERIGTRGAFYFIAGRTHPRLDADYDIRDHRIRKLIRSLHERGFEIGLHPSYSTYQNPSQVADEANALKKVCEEEGVQQTVWGGRMHYLRWDHPVTLYGWVSAGFNYDASLGFAERPGFRCGTCVEYTAFDPVRRVPLPLQIRPLVAMDVSCLATNYLGLSLSDTYETLVRYKMKCRDVRGCFSLLWHNSELYSPELRELFTGVLAA